MRLQTFYNLDQLKTLHLKQNYFRNASRSYLAVECAMQILIELLECKQY